MSESAGVDQWLGQEAQGAPAELRPFYERFQQMYSKSLWFQLTLAVEAFMSHPASSTPRRRYDLYEHFISKFSTHISHLRHVGLAVISSKQIADPAVARDFLDKLVKEMDTEETQEAFVFATMEAAHFRLILGDVDGTKSAMDKAARILDGFNTVEKGVHASFYRVCGDYYKVSDVLGDQSGRTSR